MVCGRSIGGGGGITYRDSRYNRGTESYPAVRCALVQGSFTSTDLLL